jgi:S1-C subfamily serine protease
MRRLLLAALLLPALNFVDNRPGFGQEVKKEVLDHIRNVAVSIELNDRCIGSGTLFEKDSEFYVITARHVVQAAKGKQLRAAQMLHDKKPISVNAEVIRQCEHTDVAVLKVGQGVFSKGVTFYRDCCQPNQGKPPQLDTPIVHCGSMEGLHHTVTRGYIVGLDRDMRDMCDLGPCKADQADITASFGSSGGGVFLVDGRYIGMAYAGAPQRIIFFVPIRQIQLP